MKYWNGSAWVILDAKDADTVDGKHYSDITTYADGKASTAESNAKTYADNNFQKYKLTNDATGVAIQAATDWNNYKSTGFFRASAIANQPPAIDGANTWFYVEVIAHDNASWCIQKATDFNNKGTWVRTLTNGTWSSWSRIFDDGAESIHELSKDISKYKVSKTGKDANKVFTTVTYTDKVTNKVVAKSVLSGGTSPKYTTRTVTWYKEDGTTTKETVTYTLAYDADGDLISET